MNPGTDYTARIANVEASPEYLAADGERAAWWQEFRRAEAAGDGAAAARAWTKAYEYKKRCDDMREAVR